MQSSYIYAAKMMSIFSGVSLFGYQ